MTRRLCFALDLVDDSDAIARYDWFHRPPQSWPAITASLRDSGIIDMEIYRVANRLMMIMDVPADFDLARKAREDAANPDVVRWEAKMDLFQHPILGSHSPKWSVMNRIYSLKETDAFHRQA